MPVDEKTASLLSDIAHRIRIHSIKATTSSNSGHPTSCSSISELLSVLFFNTMRYSVDEPRSISSDRFVLSKGHAAPALYAAWAEAGLIPVENLLNLRKMGDLLEGHPTPRLNFIDVATGSLGQGLSCAAGMAYSAKYMDKSSYRVYCLCGDGESAEGSIWEAMAFSSHYKLDNLVNIIDINRLGQSDPTMFQHDLHDYKRRCEAFGWNAVEVDGHDINDIVKAFEQAATLKDKPTCILAKTFKGKYFPEIEDSQAWHGKALGAKSDNVIEAVEKLIVEKSTKLGFELLPIAKPSIKVDSVDITNIKLSTPPKYELGQKMATREAYGNGLVKIGENNKRVIACDGDMKNSTFSLKFKNTFPDRFIECFIAEQNLAGVAIGCATRDRHVVFASTFAAFWARAYDQIRMGAVSLTNVNFAGSHVGCSIGEDGPSQMALEDLAMFRAIPDSTVFYPSDAVSTEYAVQLAANTKGISYIRLSRPATSVIYSNDEVFELGKAKVVVKSADDYATVVSGGVTLHEAIKAAEALKAAGKSIRIIDVFTVKPLDWQTILTNARETGNRIVVVEDHYPEGGISDALSNALLTHANDEKFKFKSLNVKSLPMSGPPAALLAKFKIDAAAIEEAVKSF